MSTAEILTLRETTYERLSLFEQPGSLQSPLFPGLTIPLKQVF